MRVIVLLRPTNKRGTKTEYTKFRKKLHADGFDKLGLDLYVRVAANRKATRKHLKRMQPHVPTTGTVIVFAMTEKQWQRKVYLVGEPSIQEQLIGTNCSIML